MINYEERLWMELHDPVGAINRYRMRMAMAGETMDSEEVERIHKRINILYRHIAVETMVEHGYQHIIFKGYDVWILPERTDGE